MGGWRELKTFLERGGLPGRRLLVSLDFDGTLAPLASRPAQARLPLRMRALLLRLAERPAVRLAIVSGRSLADVRRRVAVPGIHYAGNHGLEIEGPSLLWRHSVVRTTRPIVSGLAMQLRERVRGMRGVFIEDKGSTLSVHYRLAPPGTRPRLRELVVRALRPHAGRLALASGKMTLEVRPKVAWNKGHAILKIAGLIGGVPGLLFVGDDRTDEDGFRVLGRRAATVRVGSARGSAARFRLKGQGQVQGLVELLCGLSHRRANVVS